MRASALDDASERAIASHEAEQMSRMGNGIIENGDLPELRVPKRAAQIGEVESVEDSSDESYARNHNQQEAEASQPSSTPSAFELPSKDEAKRIRDEDNKVRDTERNFKRTLPPEILELFHKQSPKSQNGRKLTNQVSCSRFDLLRVTGLNFVSRRSTANQFAFNILSRHSWGEDSASRNLMPHYYYCRGPQVHTVDMIQRSIARKSLRESCSYKTANCISLPTIRYSPILVVARGKNHHLRSLISCKH